MKILNLIVPTLILLLVVLGCGESKTEEIKSGRLKYVENLRYGSVGSHGSQGWYVSSRRLYVNDKEFTPDGIKVEDIDGCKAASNPAVEAIKCYSFHNEQIQELNYILRMKGDQPEWIAIPGASDIWVGGGDWLLFKDFYFNVETSERREIKGLPDYPKDYFIAASPDLETIIYEENCSMGIYNLETREKIPNKLLDERCKKYYDGGIYRGVAAYWLIDVKTGDVKIIELKVDDFPSLMRPSPQGETRTGNFQQMLVWEKDKNGKDQLVKPKGKMIDSAKKLKEFPKP